MSEPTKKKMSLNQLPDTERLAKIVQRAEEHQKSKASNSGAHPGGTDDVSSDMGNDHPGPCSPGRLAHRGASFCTARLSRPSRPSTTPRSPSISTNWA